MSEQPGRQELSPEDEAGFDLMWKYGRRDVLSAPVLAVVLVVGVVLIGESLPKWLVANGVPEAVAHLYFVFPFAAVIWQAASGVRMMRRARQGMRPRNEVSAK